MLLGGIDDSTPGPIVLRTSGGAGIVLIGSRRASRGGGGAVIVLGGLRVRLRGSASGGAVIVLTGARRSSSSAAGAVTVVGGSARPESAGGEVLIPLIGGVVETLALTVLGTPTGSARAPLTGTTLTELPGGAVEPAAFDDLDAPGVVESFPGPRGRLIAGCVRGSLEGPSPAASPERAAASELPDVTPDVTGDRSVIGGSRTLAGDLWLAGGSGDCCVIGWLRGLLKGPRWLAGGKETSRASAIDRAERVSAAGSIDRGPASCAAARKSAGAERVSAPAGTERGSIPASEGRGGSSLGPTVLGGVRPGVVDPCVAGPFDRGPAPRLSDASPASELRPALRS
jgi:hypothetical protein